MSEGSDQETAVAEPIVVTETETPPSHKDHTETRTRKLPPFNVIVLNDEEHSFAYVIELLTKLFHHSIDTATELTSRIDRLGRAVVYTTHKEKAELKRDQVIAYGPDPRNSDSKTSLGCYIEPAASD